MTFLKNCAIAGVVLLSLTGCVATDFGPLNTSYDLLSNKEMEAAKLDLNGKAYAQAQDELTNSYKDLAASAYAVSQEADQKPATKVAALRLASIAAWKGGNDDIYNQAQPAGERACAQLAGGTAGVPRDCALLKYLPTLVVYERLTKTYNDPQPGNTAEKAAKMLGLLPQLDDIRAKQETLLPAITSGLPPYAGISPSAQTFFKKVAFASACLAKLYYTFGNTAKPKTPEAMQLSNDGQAVAGRFSALLVQAGELSAPNPIWYKDPNAGIVCTGTPQ